MICKCSKKMVAISYEQNEYGDSIGTWHYCKKCGRLTFTDTRPNIDEEDNRSVLVEPSYLKIEHSKRDKYVKQLFSGGIY